MSALTLALAAVLLAPAAQQATPVAATTPAEPVASAPAAAVVERPGDLVVSNFYWGRVATKTYIGDNGNITTDEPWARPRFRRRQSGLPLTTMVQRETYVQIRNAGARAVKSIQWAYVFYEDAAKAKEVQRFKFLSKDKIAPGEIKFVTESVRDVAPTAFGQVIIERVDFADGTSWQRGAASAAD